MITGKKTAAIFTIAFILPVAIYMFSALLSRTPRGDLYSETFSLLRDVRNKKKNDVIQHFSKVYKKAVSIVKDEKMLNYFQNLRRSGSTPVKMLENEIDSHFVTAYGNFYDVLFIDKDGHVFFSVKKESDYGTNIFKGKLSRTKLAQGLLQEKGDFFVGYENYSPSEEAAAFFATAITKDSTLQGWIVLQFSINRLNTMLSGNKKPGRTGEVYLVNNERLMLSESRFIEDSTILKLKVDTIAVKDALKNGQGERIIEDYRGIRVFSSYEKFQILGTTWIIIAEIDEDEIITEHYKKYNSYYIEKIIQHLSSQIGPQKQESKPVALPVAKTLRVDMNEFNKALPSKPLKTYGVSSCTAIAILYPDRFGYLLHLSPVDEIYTTNAMVRFFLGDNYTNFLSEVISRIIHYNVYRYEMSKLRFFIAAPHKESFEKAVDTILQNGAELSMITFMYNPGAISGNTVLDISSNGIFVEWNYRSGRSVDHSSSYENLGTIVKNIIKAEQLNH